MPFVSVPFAAPTYNTQQSADRVIDLMLRQGDVAAHGAQAQGNIWGNAVAGLGQQAGQYLQQRQDQQAKDAEQQRQQKIGEGINSMLQSWDGQDSLDLMKKLAAIPGMPPDAAVKIANGTTGMVKIAQAPEKTDWEAFHHVVGGAADLVKQGGLGALQAQWGTLKPALAKYADQLGMTLPDQATAEVGQMIQAYDQRFNKQAKSEDAKPGSKEWLYKVKFGERTPTPEEALAFDQQVAVAGKAPEKSLSQLAAEEKAKAQGRAAGEASGGPGAETLSPEGTEYAGTQFRITGVMPRMGQGKTGNQTRIINEAAKQAKEMGLTPASAIQKQAAYKSDAASLTQMQKMASATEAYESKANGQADIISELSPKVGRTDWPVINEAIISGKLKTGDQNTQLLVNAITTFTNEYGKIMEGSTSSAAGSTDSARAAAGRLISAALGKGTLAATLEQMKREMRLTRQGYSATMDHITERMGGAPPPAPSSPVANTSNSKWKLVETP